MRANYKMQRLFTEMPLQAGQMIDAPADAAHYLLNVMRMRDGDPILLFNGVDGEWLAHIAQAGKKRLSLLPAELVRPQPAAPNLHYCFAPLKVGRMDYMIQKAVEMGAGILQPVITQHCQMPKLNGERMQANAREAAEQCGILSMPLYREPVRFDTFINEWDRSRALIFCDEAHDTNNPLPLLRTLKGQPAGVLIGPEGGFSDEERRILRQQDFVTAIPLGPRILRADTAAVAAMALIQATIGDWS
ncbi:16S rRNA (uracil(1498)-N(3))-methyltransferase [Pseudochrobactrum sp. MP213Fo]|uniref:16S rRNA (uracil(1498)-N(3))-methyltransferase n=1 Tax=Pseudochrobactrum sp. MP213Fo TaxID=3022250 RepID=UPI003BA0BF5E